MIKTKKITGIMACDVRGVIGYNGTIPWNIKEEMAHFKKFTDGQVLIMGHNTYKSCSKKMLAKRFNVVFCRSKPELDAIPNNTVFVNSMDEIFMNKKIPTDLEWYMIGGAQIANLFLSENKLDEFILSIIAKKYSGDIALDLKVFEKWKKILYFVHEEFSIYRMLPSF